MNLLSITGLSELTGVDRRTIKNRLTPLEPVKDKRSHLYQPKEALPLIYKVNSGDYDLTAERAYLAHHQGIKAQLEVDTLKGELIPADEVLEEWSRKVMAFRSKMLALPVKTAPQLINIQDFSVAESILRRKVYNALTELSVEGQARIEENS